jgi:DNA-binding CsgD family transcriptional regulator
MRLINPVDENIKKGILIKEILKFPMHVYFQLPGGTILNCNEQVFQTFGVSLSGITSHRDLIGVHAEKFCKREYVEKVNEDDQHVIQSNKMMLFEENALPLNDDISIPLISFKFPCYWHHQYAPIIFGLSILLDHSISPHAAPLTKTLSTLLESGLITVNTNIGNYNKLFFNKMGINSVYVTNQEKKCIDLAFKGMTAKKSAHELGISFRTVERHFENLKHKFNVKSKSELLEKIVDLHSKN